MKNGQDSRRLIPLVEWNKYHPWPPIGGLRHLVFFRKQNGFNRVVRKVGSRILIDEEEFILWVDEHNRKQEDSK